MVGNEEGKRNKRRIYAQLYCVQKCGGKCAPGACILECGDSALEGEPRPHDADAEDKAATQASAASGLHDQERGGEVFMGRAPDASPSPLLPDWMVHWIAAQRHNGS
jgi:hypothetical protein